VTELPDLTCLSHDEKDALIRALWAQAQTLTTQVQILTVSRIALSDGAAIAEFDGLPGSGSGGL
jgi:hypothetical protein